MQQVDQELEEMKQGFASALNEAENTSFQLNEKMIESIVSKIKSFEKELQGLASDLKSVQFRSAPKAVDPQEFEAFKSRFEATTKDCITRVSEDAKKEMMGRLSDLQLAVQALGGRVDQACSDEKASHLENRVIKVEEKLSILDRIKKSGLKDQHKNSVLSYFLSPEEANSGRSHVQAADKKYGFDKKKVPTINLNSIIISNTDRTDGILKSKDVPPIKPQPGDDSYTSFEEEFRFRLDKTKTHGQEDPHMKLDDIKLSYVFSSTSKDGKDQMENEMLSRRLFDEDGRPSDQKPATRPEASKGRDGARRELGQRDEKHFRHAAGHTGAPQPKKEAFEEYSAILNNISHTSNQSYASAHPLSIAPASSSVSKQDKPYHQRYGPGVKVLGKSNSKKKQHFEDESNKENLNNQSNSIRVINEEGFDFEKWARENELEIGTFKYN